MRNFREVLQDNTDIDRAERILNEDGPCHWVVGVVGS